MNEVPRTMIEDLSMPRLIAGANWLLGASHISRAKDKMIRDYMNPKRMADVLEVFINAGANAIYGVMPWDGMLDAIKDAEDRTGRECIRIAIPVLNISDGEEALGDTARILDEQVEMGVRICMPHQASTDALVDRRTHTIKNMERYTAMIRERGMIPGLSTHMPETPRYADAQDLDVATYMQIYNAAGFLMQIEVDWVHRIIHEARRPVIVVKALAAGRLLPLVGLGFVWATIRDCDMVTVGTMTPDEAREVIDISLSILERRGSEVDLQSTRSKASLKDK